MIGAELHPGSSEMTDEEKWNLEVNSMVQMLNEIDPDGLNVTVYVTGDYVSEFAGNAWYKLYVTRIGSKPNHELAMYGMTTGEMLGTMSYGEQYPLMREAKRLIEAAYICDGRVIEVKGFLPQSFSQSATTLGILDRMVIEYDAGYQAGIVFEPGHVNDTWPYPVEGHDFSAVPISTHLISGELVPLSDRFAKEVLDLSGAEWEDLLMSEFDECAEGGDPMVVIFTNVVTGEDEGYMEAYRNFIDRANSKDASFVSTLELVEMARSRTG
ncbi:MAG TPA: hypothetical protein PLM24_02650 [Methanothrix sp.]|nr:hypothetical protein [Methanothrix sp.]HPR66017.1 hypothetical protein [Methanothrix sp.]